ncbi:hypothetical protein [Streptomyces sp. NPDC002851]
MTTEATDSPASLYGTASVVLGTLALIAVVFSGHAGVAIPLLSGSLAVTFGVLGLMRRLNRVRCAIGLSTGGGTLLYLGYLLATFAG